MFTARTLLRLSRGPIFVLLALMSVPVPALAGAPDQQQATPTATYSCDDATGPAGTPAMDHGDMADMDTSSPMAGMAVEFDQLYIDMMIPHHASIVAMARAAEERLTDERLSEIARRIVDTQTAEIAELQGYREAFYGRGEPMPMDPRLMTMMDEAMPGMADSLEDMAHQMNPTAQVAEFCAAADSDLAFIEITIPHHEMAIAASEAALDQATHGEIRTFAGRVIADQQREIEELSTILAELAGLGTPVGVRVGWR